MVEFLAARNFVKICGVTSVADALMVASSGADAVGLNFAVSTRHVERDVAREVVRATPDLVHVGIFRDNDDAYIVDTATATGVGVAQIHGYLSEATTRRLHDENIRVVKALSVNEPDFLAFDEHDVDAVLIDGAEPGSGVGYARTLVTRRSFLVPVIVAGGLTSDNVASVIDELTPWGVDVATGVEASPRVKDPLLVTKFVTLAREAFEREENT